MSSGHRHHPTSEHLKRALVYLSEPDIALAMATRPQVIDVYDVPAFGGSSIELLETGGPAYVFIDRSIARKAPRIAGMPYARWLDAIVLHEQFEAVLWWLRNLKYPEAHMFASAAENDFVKDTLRAKPRFYEKDLEPLIAKVENKLIRVPPPDLACFPYRESGEKRDRKMLGQLAELGVVDAQWKQAA